MSAFGRTTGSAVGNVGNTGWDALPGALPRVRSKPPAQAVTPLRVVDFTLAQALGDSPACADASIPDLLYSLQTQTPSAVADGWRVYLQTPLARLYERQTGQGGFAHGMGAMLVLPARGLEAFRGAECSVFAADTAQVIGASLPDAAGSGTKRLPQLYGFDATRLETDWRPPRERHWQAMSLPLLLPGWRAVPGQGLHAGWQALVAHEGSAEPTLAGWIEQVAHQFRASLWVPTLRAMQRHHAFDEADTQLERLAKCLQAAEVAVAQAAAQAFVGHLDAVVAHGCVARRGALRPAEYNWVAAGATARTWQWRMEALEIFPGLCTSAVQPALPVQVPSSLSKRSSVLRRLKRWAEDPTVRGAYTLCQAVDQGLPLIKHLSRTFSVGPVTIRALRGVEARDAVVLQSPPLGWPDLLRALDAIAPERHPRSPEAWQAFSLLYTEALHAWRVVHMLNIGLGQRFMVEVLRPWLARLGRDWEAAATRWRDGFRRVDGLHVASAWGQDLKVLLGSPRLSPPLRQPLVEALARAPLTMWQQMVEQREAWQAPLKLAAPQPAARAMAAFGWQRGLLLVGEWPAECRAGPWHRLTDELVLDVGLPISPLNGEAVLQRESGVMQHCIHTYTRQLLSRSQLAFALGADGHADRSTVLVQCNRAADGRWHVQLKQHRAARNRPPSPACEAAVRRLTDRLMASDAREAMDRVEHARILRLQTLGSLRIAEEPTWLVNTRAAAAREAERVAAVALIASRAWHVLRRVKLLDEECGP